MKKINLKRFTINKNFSYWFLLIFLVTFHIVFGLRTVSLGGQLSDLEKEERKLKAEMKDLNSELVQKTSLTRIKETSQNLGFAKPSTTIYLNDNEFVARLPF